MFDASNISLTSNVIEAVSEFTLAVSGICSAIAYFHHSYRIQASFDIDNQSFSRLKITFINNSRKANSLIEFEGIIPSKQDIIYDKSFVRKRIKITLPYMIHYDKSDSNYNPSYVRYFRKFKTMKPHSALKRIEFPLTDLIKICKINRKWRSTIINELIYNRKISFVVLFKDSKRHPIYKTIAIDPQINNFQAHTYNFMISEIFNRKTLRKILRKQNMEIDKDNKINRSINNLKILP